MKYMDRELLILLNKISDIHFIIGYLNQIYIK